MTSTIGLERLPRTFVALLLEAAQNLQAAADDLATLVRGRPVSAALARREDEGDRIVHELAGELHARQRLGPDAERVLALAQALDDVVDTLDELAWAWARHPIPELASAVLAARDAARSMAPAVSAFEAGAPVLAVKLEHGRERRLRAQQESRDGREWLLVRQSDTQLAVLGHELLARVDAVVGASGRLGQRLARSALG
jgi:hypothetical protein